MNRTVPLFSPFKEVFIASVARTPVGSFRGGLSSLSAPELGGIAIKSAVSRANLRPEDVQEVYFGNVISSNLGQAPATQAARAAGIPSTVPCTLVNKVCASGLKAVMMASQSIALGYQEVMVAGGMESMSNAPYLLEKARSGFGYGHQQVSDAIIKDGLWDPLYQIHMGSCAEETAERFKISRQEQDKHAIMSYERSAQASKSGQFKSEIVPVEIVRKGKVAAVVDCDEEFSKVDFSKIPKLNPVFKKNGGTVTAANASTLNDGASAVVLTSESFALKKNLKPIARILGYADANRDPKEFTIAPADAIPKALHQAGLKIEDISLFEINEAFSVVVLANEKILQLNPDKVNVAGGGVSLGHPIGSSGCRILVSLVGLLKKGEYGCAAICNGGGGASAMIIQKL